MAEQPIVQRSGAEVVNAPAEVISEWLHEGALADLMAGNDLGKPDPIKQPVADPPADPPSASEADLGARGRPAKDQLEAHQLGRMSPEAIVAARKAGRLDKLLGIGSR